MGERLVFPDAYAASDMLTFAGRAARAGDGSVQVCASAGTLRTAAAPLVRQGLLDATPTIVGMRMLPVDPELECDLVVEAVELQGAHDDARAVELPATGLEPPLWARAPLPRSGWERIGSLASDALVERAQWGMSAVAHALPIDPGEQMVLAVRGRVWSEPDPDVADLPRGVAFTAWSLGFLGEQGEQAGLYRNGRWVRLSLTRGHVLLRGPAHTGMTAVRTTAAHTTS